MRTTFITGTCTLIALWACFHFQVRAPRWSGQDALAAAVLATWAGVAVLGFRTNRKSWLWSSAGFALSSSLFSLLLLLGGFLWVFPFLLSTICAFSSLLLMICLEMAERA
jgi:hypothetical protein